MLTNPSSVSEARIPAASAGSGNLPSVAPGPGVGDCDEELVLMVDARRILLEPSCSDPQQHLSDLKRSSERMMAWIECGALEVSRRLQAMDTIRSKLEGFQRTPAYSSAKGKADYYHFSAMLEEADRQLDDF